MGSTTWRRTPLFLLLESTQRIRQFGGGAHSRGGKVDAGRENGGCRGELVSVGTGVTGAWLVCVIAVQPGGVGLGPFKPG
jgi:hypothetical protein